jgi:hypothetical protein
MHRQGSPVPESAIAPQIHEPLNIHGHFRAKFPFYLVFVIDYLANAVNFSLGKFVCAGIRVYVEFAQDPIGRGSSDTIYVGQTDLYPFTPR